MELFSDINFWQGSVMLVFLAIIMTALVIKIFYLLTLQRTLEAVKPELRTMPPARVWLELIPLFNLVWQFFNVIHVADSLKAEMASRNMRVAEDRPAYGIGIAHCVLSCVAVLPVFGTFVGIGALVCWIIYWAKVSGYKKDISVPDYSQI
jgi:hypothetical protein